MNEIDKLKARPIESDTAISKEQIIDFGEFKGLLENWYWDGILGSSVIVLKETVALFKSEKDLHEFIFKKIEEDPDQRTTSKFKGDYYFLNFNFRTMDSEYAW